MKSWQRWCVSNILSEKKLLSCFKFIYLANLRAGHILTNLLRKSLIGKLKPLLEKWKVKSWCLPFHLLAPHHTPSPLRPHPDVQDRSSMFVCNMDFPPQESHRQRSWWGLGKRSRWWSWAGPPLRLCWIRWGQYRCHVWLMIVSVQNRCFWHQFTQLPKLVGKGHHIKIMTKETKYLEIDENKLMICRTESGITHPSSSSPFGHWAIRSHLNKKSSQRMLVVVIMSMFLIIMMMTTGLHLIDL